MNKDVWLGKYGVYVDLWKVYLVKFEDWEREYKEVILKIFVRIKIIKLG